MNVTQYNTAHVEEGKRLQSVVLCINAFVQRPTLQQTKGVELWLRSSRVYCKNIKKKIAIFVAIHAEGAQIP